MQPEIKLVCAADYDEEGLKMAWWMAHQFGATISMSAESYMQADHERGPAWSGPIPQTPWDEQLVRAIESKRRVVYQEDPAIWCGLVRGAASMP